MSRNANDSFKQIHGTHQFLIGAPLVLILVFCFSFVLLHPVNSDAERSSSQSSNAKSDKSAATESQTELPTIPMSQVQFQSITPAAPVDDATSDPAAVATDTPQTSKTSSTHSANPQATSSSRQQITSKTIISLPKATVSIPSLLR